MIVMSRKSSITTNVLLNQLVIPVPRCLVNFTIEVFLDGPGPDLVE